MVDIEIKCEVITDRTPTMPDARRGAVYSGESIKETAEQLNADLCWWPCSFCESRVLVDVYGTGEKCTCGAERFNTEFSEGWKRDGIEWMFI